MFCLWLPPNLDGLLAAPREAAAFLQAWEILAGRERGVLARWAAAPGHIAYRSRAPAALCCDRLHLIRFISQTKSRGVKFELAGKPYPSKEIIIFCAVKCIIGIFRRFIKTVKKEKRETPEHLLPVGFTGACFPLRGPGHRRRQWVTVVHTHCKVKRFDFLLVWVIISEQSSTLCFSLSRKYPSIWPQLRGS